MIILLHDNNTNIIILLLLIATPIHFWTWLWGRCITYFNSLNLMTVGTIVIYVLRWGNWNCLIRQFHTLLRDQQLAFLPFLPPLKLKNKKESVFGELVCIVKSSSLCALESRGGDRPGPWRGLVVMEVDQTRWEVEGACSWWCWWEKQPLESWCSWCWFQFPLCLYTWWLSSKESMCQCRGPEFNPWVGKIIWRGKWQPAPVFLPEKSHGQRSLVGYSPKSQT